ACFEGPGSGPAARARQEPSCCFRVTAMKQAREPQDDVFLAAQKQAITARAHALEQSGDLLAALRANREAATAFSGLTDVSEFQRTAASLAGQKAVRDAEKRQKRELQEQAALTRDISDGLNALQRPPTERAGLLHATERKIRDLREHAEHEKRLDQARVLQRAVSDVFAQALETGFGRLSDNDAASAKDYFQLALAAQPDSLWALHSLAAACAVLGDRKGALDSIRRAKEKTEDRGAFAAWLENEPAFEKLRSDAQFQALSGKP